MKFVYIFLASRAKTNQIDNIYETPVVNVTHRTKTIGTAKI